MCSNPVKNMSVYADQNQTPCLTYVNLNTNQSVNLRMQHNSYFAISLYACVARGAVV